MSFNEQPKWESLPGRGDRKIGLSSRFNNNGALVLDNQTFRYESWLEAKVFIVLMHRENFVSLREQVAFDWIDQNGEEHTHYFDAVVEFAQ